MKDVTMDNDAGIDKRTVWLAGYMDGDGFVGLHRYKIKNGFRYEPTIGFTTTCLLTCEYLDELLKELQVGHYIKSREMPNPNHKTQHNFQIRGHKRVKKFLELCKDYMITKQEESELLLEYINIRESAGNKRAVQYNSRELEIFDRLREIKLKRNSSLRSSPQRLPSGDSNIESMA